MNNVSSHPIVGGDFDTELPVIEVQLTPHLLRRLKTAVEKIGGTHSDFVQQALIAALAKNRQCWTQTIAQRDEVN